MMNFEQSIPCPVCGTKIPFNTNELLKGVTFACSNCKSAIGLAQQSKAVVKEAMDKLEELRMGLSKPNPNTR